MCVCVRHGDHDDDSHDDNGGFSIVPVLLLLVQWWRRSKSEQITKWNGQQQYVQAFIVISHWDSFLSVPNPTNKIISTCIF